MNPSLAKNPQLDQWISLDEPGRITIYTGKVDIGQRIGRALTLIAAAELRVASGYIDLRPACTDGGPDEGYTVGSNSIEQSGEAVRQACRTAMQHLLTRAADQLGVPLKDLEARDGFIRSAHDDRRTDYWALMLGRRFDCAILDLNGAGAADPAGDTGCDAPAPEQRSLVDGSAVFLHDLFFDDMLHARVLRPTMMHAQPAGLPQALLARLVEEGFYWTEQRGFLAIAGRDECEVVRAAARLSSAISWQLTAHLPTTSVQTLLRNNPRVSLPVVDGCPQKRPVPSVPPPPASAAHTVELQIFKPYLMHGSLAPSAAAALYDAGSCRMQVWTHSQGVHPLRSALAVALNMDAEHLSVRHVRGPGCYGHNGADDAALDAALVARAVPGKHVLLKWSREDEHAWEPYGSAMTVDVRASIDGRGKIVQWIQEACSDGHLMRPFPHLPDAGASRLLASRQIDADYRPPRAEPMMFHHAGIHRNLEPCYDVGDAHLVKTLVREMPLRSSSLRSLGAAANVWAIESMMDALAMRIGMTPLQFRVANCNDARAVDVLRHLQALLPEQAVHSDTHSAWGTGFARYKNEKAYCAVAVELHIDEHAVIHLQQAIIVAEAGRAVDHQGMRAQLEGGFFQAASWALLEEVTFDQDGVTSRDWDSYPVLRIERSCCVNTQLIDRPDLPSLGLGEASSGPALAAIANAASAALGIRLTRTPFTPQALQQAVLEN